VPKNYRQTSVVPFEQSNQDLKGFDLNQ